MAQSRLSTDTKKLKFTKRWMVFLEMWFRGFCRLDSIAIELRRQYPKAWHRRALIAPDPPPALAEQKRIARILDAADALRAKRREALAQLDTLLQSTFLDMFGDPVTNPDGVGGAKATHGFD